MLTIVQDALLVLPHSTVRGSLSMENGRIRQVLPSGRLPEPEGCQVVEAGGAWLLPGVVDEHVHFRDPGLTHKADWQSESRAALLGGVTTVVDMPNTVPQTTTLEALEEKIALARRASAVDFRLMFGATSTNAALIARLRRWPEVAGVKVFMGASTGGMLVDRREALLEVFRACQEAGLCVMTHCEDTATVQAELRRVQQLTGQDDPPVEWHTQVRSRQACVRSTRLALELARETGARLHIAHLSTLEELEMVRESGPNVTAEVCVPHLLFCQDDYARLGTRIKCNPSVKTAADRAALRRALTDPAYRDKLVCIATDHAPHLLSEKQGGCRRAASGMPMVQFSLPAMATMALQTGMPMERLCQLMCAAPARLWGLTDRGRLEPGLRADLVLLRREPFTPAQADVVSKCGWSPLEGQPLSCRVERVFTMHDLMHDA